MTRAQVPWDLSFLRVGALVTAAATAVAAPVTGALAGWPHAVGVVVGAAVVVAFFSLSAYVIARAGAIDDTFTLPAALAMFFVKAVVLFGVLNALPEDGWLDRLTMAWTVIVGVLLWSAVQLRWVWTRKIYYVQPPALPSRVDGVASAVDRENPSTRG